nr:ORF1 [Torque teno sus virus]
MRFRRRRIGRRRRRYRKRRWGWKRRYYRRRAWRRRHTVRKRRRSVFRRGGRRARPYRISAWNPRVVRSVVIKGWWPVIQCMAGQEYLRYKTMDGIEMHWIINNKSTKITSEPLGYLLQYGGGWSSGTITLEGLFKENRTWRNIWSKSNDGMDLVRYFGCSITLYPTENQDYWFWYDTDFDETARKQLDEFTQPAVMMMAKNTRLIMCKNKMPVRRRPKRIFIPPPSQMTTQWKMQTEMCRYALFNWACGVIDTDTPFDYNGSWRNAWWTMQRLDNGNMEYIEKWGRIPPQGDQETPDSSDFKAGGDNPNWKPIGVKKIYPIVALLETVQGKKIIKWGTIHNKELNHWRQQQAVVLKISKIRGLCIRVLSNSETYYRWTRGDFQGEFWDVWKDSDLLTVRFDAGQNPTVEAWSWNANVPQSGTLKDYFNISHSSSTGQWQDSDFALLNLPKAAINIDFGHKTRFGPFCVKNPPIEFKLEAPKALNIWVKYKFFFQFGGMYQPPTGISDPCNPTATYPVRMAGAVTHPKYAGRGNLREEDIGMYGITPAAMRAICAAPPEETLTQSAFQREETQGEAREETESETSFTSAESSSEGDGSPRREEERRAARKRAVKLFLRYLRDRPVDHKRRRLSE